MHEPFHCQCKYDYFICVTILSDSSLNFPCIHNILRIKKTLEGKQDFKMMSENIPFWSAQANWPLQSPGPAHTEWLPAPSFEYSYAYEDRAPDSPPEAAGLT